MQTFSRRGREAAVAPSPSKQHKQPAPPNAFESLLCDESDPFYFPREASGDAQAAQPPRAAGRATAKASGSPSPLKAAAARTSGKGGGGGKGRAQRLAAPPAQAPPLAQASAVAVEKASEAAAGGRPSGKGGKAVPAAKATAAPATKPPVPKQRPPPKPANSLLSQRNPAGNTTTARQQQAATGAEEQQPARPSVRSRPAAAAGQQQQVAGGACAASVSPVKRKAATAVGVPPVDDASPSKKQRLKMQGSDKVGDAAAAAAAAPAAARAGGPPSGRASGGMRAMAAASFGAAAGGNPLLTALRPAALQQQAAATTVVQAQALGEQQSITDDALWALDGLASGSAATLRDSLAALAEICASRRGRLALRTGQLATDVLEAAAGLKVSPDPVHALGLATLLLCFCQADADTALLGRRGVAAAAAQLLKLSSTLDASPAAAPATSASAAAKLAGVLKERPYSLQLPPEERGSPLSVALAALADVLDPSKTERPVEGMKAALREAGALEAAAQVVADTASALCDPDPTLQTVRSLWRLHKALHLLESACFACPENEERLLAASVTTGVAPMLATSGFVGWLVQQLSLLAQQPLIAGIKKDCLRALLAVLLNATQNNPAGCAAVVAAGVLEPAAAVLSQIVRGGPKFKGVASGEGELAVWHDVLSTCMALFCNIVEHEGPAAAGWRATLRALQLPDPCCGSGRVALVPLLCSLLALVAAPAGTPGDAPQAEASLGRRASLGSGEVSADCLAHQEDRDTRSMTEVYAAVLLGFLIQDDGEARRQAAALLPGRSLQGVAAAVGKALHFYAAMGAMAQDNVNNLRALLASLKQDDAAAAAGGDSDDSPAPSPVLG